MNKLIYVTSNSDKVIVANKYLNPLGIHLMQKTIELVEIQSDSVKEITKNKAEQAFAAIKKPLLVNDAGWNFVALNGFPGVYMKYVSNWLSPKDFITIMERHKNKTVIYTECLCYIDNHQIKCFEGKIEGIFLDVEKGNGIPSWTLISLRKDKKSIAESWEEGIDPTEEYPLWQNFADWHNSISR